MKLLIATAWYYPFIHPRARRWTVLAEQWASEGHEVYVLTAKIKACDKNAEKEQVMVYRTGFDSLKEWVYYWFGGKQLRGRVGQPPAPASAFGKVLAWVYRKVWKGICFPDDACLWYWPARKKLKKLLETQDFDAIITVSFPFTGHLLGLYAIRHKPKLVWMADVGDPFVGQYGAPNNPLLYDLWSKRLEKRVLLSADVVCVTTPALTTYYNQIYGKACTDRIHVVPPLYSGAASMRAVEAPLVEKNKIRIGYFGALYAPTRTPDAFLQLLSTFLNKFPSWEARLEIHFYGEIFPEFYPSLSKEKTILLHGLQSRETAVSAMVEMDFLLHIGNVSSNQLPSKVAYYFCTGKPVLHLSYVEPDPFLQFWFSVCTGETGSPLFIVPVKDGLVETGRLDLLKNWLEQKHKLPDAQILQERQQLFSAAAIGGQYLDLICGVSK